MTKQRVCGLSVMVKSWTMEECAMCSDWMMAAAAAAINTAKHPIGIRYSVTDAECSAA